MNDRVEAAKKIRGYGEWLDVYSYTSAAPKAIDRLRDAIVNTYDYAVLLDGLADLIDPKCYLERSEWIQDDGEHIEWEWHCTNCDFDLTKRYGDLYTAAREELGLLYCPHCGARIIGTIFDKG